MFYARAVRLHSGRGVGFGKGEVAYGVINLVEVGSVYGIAGERAERFYLAVGARGRAHLAAAYAGVEAHAPGNAACARHAVKCHIGAVVASCGRVELSQE